VKRASIATVVAVCLSCSHAPQVREVSRPWWEVSSAHFSVRTDLDEGDARRAVGQLEEIRSMMLRAGLGRTTDDGARVRVVVFSSRKDLSSITGDRYLSFTPTGPPRVAGTIGFTGLGAYGIEQATGFYTLGPEGTTFAYAADVLDDKALRIAPTFAAVSALPFRAPRWLEIGFPIYAAGFRLDGDRKRGSSADASGSAFGLLRDKGWTDVRLLLEERPAPEGGDEEQSWQNACWLLVSYFRVERAQEFADYLSRLEAGEFPNAAFAKAFHGLDPRDVQPLVRGYVERGPSPREVAAEPYRGPLSAARLDTAEVHATWAEQYRKIAPEAADDRGANLKAAAVEEKEALRLDPENVSVRLALIRSLPEPDQVEGLRELVQKKPDEPRASLALAAALPPDRDAERLSLLDRCCTDPARPEPLAEVLRAETLFRLHDARSAVASAEAALRHGVREPSVLRIEAVSLASAGRCDDAAYVQRKAARRVPPALPVASQRSLFEELQAYEDGCSIAPEPQRSQGLVRPVRDPASCPPNPQYPLPTRAAGGAVELEYILSATGRVYAVHPVDPSAPSGVYFAAEEWLRSCSFSPAKTSSGEAVPVRMRMGFRVGK